MNGEARATGGYRRAEQPTLKGTEIPAPERGEVMNAFKKIARPAPQVAAAERESTFRR